MLLGIVGKYRCLNGSHVINDMDKKKISTFDVYFDSFNTHCKSCNEPLVITQINNTNVKSIKIEEEREGWWYNPDSEDDKKLSRPSFTPYDPRIVYIGRLYKRLAKYNSKIRMVKSVKPTYDELLDLANGISRLLGNYSLSNGKASIAFSKKMMPY